MYSFNFTQKILTKGDHGLGAVFPSNIFSNISSICLAEIEFDFKHKRQELLRESSCLNICHFTYLIKRFENWPVHCGPEKSRIQYWVTRLSVRSFARTAHSFACSALLASLACSAACTRLLSCFTNSLACGTVNDWMAILSVFFSILAHSVSVDERFWGTYPLLRHLLRHLLRPPQLSHPSFSRCLFAPSINRPMSVAELLTRHKTYNISNFYKDSRESLFHRRRRRRHHRSLVRRR